LFSKDIDEFGYIFDFDKGKKMNSGVIYTAIGAKYIEQAKLSAKSIKNFCPELSISVYTDNLEQAKCDFFDEVILVEKINSPKHQRMLDRLLNWSKSPYDYTLALDTDTYILDDIQELFAVLEKFDLAICHGHNRVKRYWRTILDNISLDSIPYAFAPVQGGLFLYKKSDQVEKFLQDLILLYKQKQVIDDQVSIRELIWQSNLRVYILPPEYDFNSIEDLKRWAKFDFIEARPKIFHYTRHKRDDIENLVKPFIPLFKDTNRNVLGSQNSTILKSCLDSSQNVYIVSYPKSGSTWLRFLLGNYITNNKCDFVNCHSIIPDIHLNPQDIELITRQPKFIKSHYQFTPDYQKVIYLARDGRDVAVSAYFHLLKEKKISKDTSFSDFMEKFNAGNLWPQFGTWNNHINSWLDNSPNHFLLVSYEDLKANTTKKLIEILEFAEINVNTESVATAIEASSFQRMQKMEEAQTDLCNLAKTDRNLKFVRSGRVGEYQSYFNHQLLKDFRKSQGKAIEKLEYLREETDSFEGDILPKFPRAYTMNQNSNNNIVLTGVPRGGTTLTCYLLNQLPNTVALNEPMSFSEIINLSNNYERATYCLGFFQSMRYSIINHRKAESKIAQGKLIDNMAGEYKNSQTAREWLAKKTQFKIEKQLDENFMLVIKKPDVFTGLLDYLVQYLPTYAVVRNPLSILASWNTLPLKLKEGHSGLVKLDNNLANTIAKITGKIEKQICLLSSYYEKFSQFLPSSSIIYYEEIVETKGKVLSKINANAVELDSQIESKNLNSLYDRELMLVLGEKLLKSKGVFWEFYSRESVESLLSLIVNQNEDVQIPNANANGSIDKPDTQQVVDLLNVNKNTEAVEMIEKLMVSQPDLISLNYGKAIALSRLGKTTEAIQTLEQMLKELPNHRKGRFLLSKICQNQ
jgi:hypothetical protein